MCALLASGAHVRAKIVMREIKFRAWDKTSNRMGAVYSLHQSGSCHVRDGNLLLNKDECELMQFTGLKDKNGKEIYEGDIVKCDVDVYTVEWGKYVTDNAENEDILGWLAVGKMRAHTLDPQVRWEIIGNIYEDRDVVTPANHANGDATA
jgi:uncharacterized phage protein (TIGR01671 family)